MMLDYLPPDIETRVLELKTGIDNASALTIVNVANQLRSNTQEPITVSTRHTLMIAEMVAIGSSVGEAFTNSLQVSRDVLESILLSLHLELGLRGKEQTRQYIAY
jgi:nitric oxide reductase NorQ protein